MKCCDEYTRFYDAREYVIEVEYCAMCGKKIDKSFEFRAGDTAVVIKKMSPSYGPFWRYCNDPKWTSHNVASVDDEWIKDKIEKGYYQLIRNGRPLPLTK